MFRMIKYSRKFYACLFLSLALLVLAWLLLVINKSALTAISVILLNGYLILQVMVRLLEPGIERVYSYDDLKEEVSFRVIEKIGEHYHRIVQANCDTKSSVIVKDLPKEIAFVDSIFLKKRNGRIMWSPPPIVYREKVYQASFRSLLRDIKKVSAIAIQAVWFNGSGGFPAPPPKGGIRIR